MVKNHTGNLQPPLDGYFFFQSRARYFLYASSHREVNTYHDLMYASHVTLVGTEESSMIGLLRFSPATQVSQSSALPTELTPALVKGKDDSVSKFARER